MNGVYGELACSVHGVSLIPYQALSLNQVSENKMSKCSDSEMETIPIVVGCKMKMKNISGQVRSKSRIFKNG